MNAKYFILLLCFSNSAWAIYNDDQQPQPIIQYKPKPPAQPITGAEDLKRQAADIDRQIQELTGERENSRQKAVNTKAQADEVLSEYNRLLDQVQKYQLEMQQNDDSIAELVRKKAEISKQIKG